MSISDIKSFNPGMSGIGVNDLQKELKADKTSAGFGDLVSKGINSVNQDLSKATQTSQEFFLEGKHSLHEVMINLEKADVSFRFMTQIRNKVLEAYNDVMRTQV